MRYKFGFLIVLIAQLTGCVGMESTYKPFDISGGYGEEKLSENAYIVFFDANSFTPPELSKKYFLRRASQLALKNDFDCFVVIEEKKTLNENYITSNKLALKTKYYSSPNGFGDSNSNKIDINSLSGIVQMYKDASAPANCNKAILTIELTNKE